MLGLKFMAGTSLTIANKTVENLPVPAPIWETILNKEH